jgi:2,6-dihydroxypyridine 3-monooxygenase
VIASFSQIAGLEPERISPTRIRSEGLSHLRGCVGASVSLVWALATYAELLGMTATRKDVRGYGKVKRKVTPRIVVVGGSLGGLNAALWLCEASCDVVVFERAPAPPEGRGAGIVLNPATIRYFAASGVVDVDRISASARWFRYFDGDGNIGHEEACRYRFTSYNSLYRGLRGCFDEGRYHLGEECVAFERRGEGMTARFASGRSESCDLLVFADGLNSTGRPLLLPDVAPRYAGYVAWRGTVGEAELPADAFDPLHEAITYRVLADSHALAYPIPSAEGSVKPGRLLNWLWYRNISPGPQLDELLTGKDGVRFASSLPPGFVREEHLRRLRADADAELPPPLSEMIARTEQPFLQVIVEVAVSRMAFGRVCLIGDAAVTLRPHIAAGTAKAAEDGWKLAEAVSGSGGDIVAALRRWEPSQLALGRQALVRAQDAGERLQGGRWDTGDALPWGLYEAGDSSMVEQGEA